MSIQDLKTTVGQRVNTLLDVPLSATRASDDWRSALNVGTTLTTRLWLAFAMVLYGAGFLLNQGSWLKSPTFERLNQVLPLSYWGLVFAGAGLLGLWRVFSPRGAPVCGLLVNALIFFIWSTSTIIRYYGLGSASLASPYTAFLFMSFWCLYRTMFTARDKETA